MTSATDPLIDDVFTLDKFYTVDDLNRLFETVMNNIRTFGTLLNNAEIGQALHAYSVPTDPTVQEGQPVFFNTTSMRFEATQLQTLYSGGRLHASESSEAWGIVRKKCSSDRADLLLAGLDEVDLTKSAGEAAPTGKLYLSAQQGLLVASPDSALVCPALLAAGDGRVLFRPWFADNYPRYIPKSLVLSTDYAGASVSVAAGVTTIVSPNAALAGWLPAAHAVFEGNQPLGARFGYNLAVDAVLSDAWPPLEPELSKLFMDVGGTESRGSHVLLGNGERVAVNEHGIWWMSDCATQLPWDFAPEGAAGQVVCPKSASRRLVLETTFGMTQSNFDTSVNSLASEVPWLKPYNKSTGLPGTSGDLSLRLDPSAFYGDESAIDGLAVKGFEVDGKMTRGPVVSGVKSTSPSLLISGGKVEGGYRYGQVSMAVSATMDFDLLPNDTKLLGASTEEYGSALAIGLLPQHDTSFSSEFAVPASVPEGAQLRFAVWLLMPSTSALPANMTATVRRLPRPVGGQALSIPAAVDLPWNYTPGLAMTGGRYVEAVTDLVEVSGGDLLYLTLARAGSTDGISIEVHVLNLVGRFESAE